ncbi:MAG: membrane dipeptidase [Desulfobacterales bacterium]
MKDKKYDGYLPYQYLDPARDYRRFRLTAQLERVPSHPVEVTEEQEARVRGLIRDNVVISLHDHPQVYPASTADFVEYSQVGRGHLAYEGLAHSGLDTVFDNMFDGTTLIHSKHGWKWTEVVHDIGMRTCDVDHQKFLLVAREVNDILYAAQTGRVALVLTLESATPIENELERLEILYGLGVRMMGITYSESNALGDGLRETRDGGLTTFGREAVRRMNQIGMAIDVSHCGDRTSLDTIEASDDPIFISHAGARALWNTARMMPDEVLLACAQKGGLVGIEAAPHTTLTQDHRSHSIESFMEHFEYCVDLLGIDHVTFGPDTLYGDHVGLHHAFQSHLSIGKSHAHMDFEEVEYVEGLENPSECFPNIVRWLVKHGYSDVDISKVIGGNTLRVLGEVWCN